MSNKEIEKPPFLNAWIHVYGLVILVLVLLIIFFYCFSKYFA